MINSPLFNVPSLSLGFIIFRIHFLKYSASWCFLKMLAGSSTPVLLDITLSLWESQNSWGSAVTQPCAYYSVMSNSLKPMDCSTPGFSVHGDSPDRILKWVAMPSSWESSQPKDQTQVSCHFPALGLGVPHPRHAGYLDILFLYATPSALSLTG